jgi:sporulation protein YlmC with PRC-barrel domain
MGLLHPGQQPAPPVSVSPEAAPIAGRARHAGGPGRFVMACSTLVGDRVVDARGEELGSLEQLMIDVPAGRIAYGVLARGGVLGLGARLFAVPWHAFTLDAERDCLVLDLEPRSLEAFHQEAERH